MQYTIKKINSNRTIDVSFDIDNLVQNLDGAPIDNAAALQDFLFKYGTAYEAGIKAVTPAPVDPAVSALIGQVQTAAPPQGV
jgi:hypothetical protein